MAKVAFVPYNETMAQIFAALNISLAAEDFGGQQGWALEAYQGALSDAWDALFLLDEFEFDGQAGDDWDLAESLIHGDYQIMYWSTESGHMPT